MAIAAIAPLKKTKELIEMQDRATTLATKLNALLAMTYGEGGENFRSMPDEMQDEYMWACSDMARELKDLIFKLDILRNH